MRWRKPLSCYFALYSQWAFVIGYIHSNIFENFNIRRDGMDRYDIAIISLIIVGVLLVVNGGIK